MTRILFCLSAVMCLLAGCEPCPHYRRVQATSLTGVPAVPQQKKPYGTVKLFQDKTEVTGKYEVLSIMSLEGSAGDEARFITAFLYRAADMGADAVILYRGTQGAVAATGPFGITDKELRAAYRAEAIRFQ